MNWTYPAYAAGTTALSWGIGVAIHHNYPVLLGSAIGHALVAAVVAVCGVRPKRAAQ